MQPSDFDWHGGEVVSWDLDRVEVDVAVALQAKELKEDLAQVEYGAAVLVDVGYYPSFSPDGHFVVCVIRDRDWEEPVFRRECNEVDALCAALREAITIAGEATTST